MFRTALTRVNGVNHIARVAGAFPTRLPQRVIPHGGSPFLNGLPQRGIRKQSQGWRRIEYQYYYSNGSDRDERAFKAIILANLLVFANWRMGWPLSYDTLMRYFTASTYGVFGQKNIVSLVGSAFSHIEPAHIFANMFTFYFFGNDVFHTLGRRAAVAMYVLAGAAGSYAQVWQGKSQHYNASVIGASGAVSSFVVFSILQNPRATIIVWFILPIPAALFGLLYVFQDVYGLSHRQQTSRGIAVGHEAHLAGSLVGLLAWLGRRRLYF